MSIHIQTKNLSTEQRKHINDTLYFETPKKEWIVSYDLNPNKSIIYLPFSYAVSQKFKRKKRDHFETREIQFSAELREYQQETVQQIIPTLKKTGSCLLSLHVGWGKSVVAIYLASRLRFKTLIVVNKIVLANQWIDLIQNVSPNSKIHFLKPKNKLDENADFYIINAMNTPKFPNDFLQTIGTVICDEVHLICAKNLFKTLFKLQPRYLIGLSATPTRPDGLTPIIHFFFGQNTIVEKLNKKHHVYEIQTGLGIAFRTMWNGKLDWHYVLEQQSQNERRNQLIIDIIQHFSDRFFLVLCKRIEQGKYLFDQLKEKGESVTELLGTKKDFDESARILIATSQKCGTGFSHNKLNTLILASDMEEYFIQYLGRVFRTPETEPVIFDLVDNHNVLRKHFKTRKKVYQEAGGIIHTIHNTEELFQDDFDLEKNEN